MKSTGRGRKLLYAPLPRPSRCAWKPLRTPLHTGSADKVWPGRGAARSAGFLTRAGQGMPPLPFSICGETMSKTTMGSTSVLQGGPGVTRKSAERQCRASLELGGRALLAGRSPHWALQQSGLESCCWEQGALKEPSEGNQQAFHSVIKNESGNRI